MEVGPDVDLERFLGEVDAGHVVAEELGAEARGLLAHLFHEFGTHDPVDEAGIVLDLGRQHQLAAGRDALDHQGLQIGAGRVHRGGQTGGTGSDDDDVTDVLRHVLHTLQNAPQGAEIPGRDQGLIVPNWYSSGTLQSPRGQIHSMNLSKGPLSSAE